MGHIHNSLGVGEGQRHNGKQTPSSLDHDLFN